MPSRTQQMEILLGVLAVNKIENNNKKEKQNKECLQFSKIWFPGLEETQLLSKINETFANRKRKWKAGS